MANRTISCHMPCDHCGQPLSAGTTVDECTFCQDLCLTDHDTWLRLVGLA